MMEREKRRAGQHALDKGRRDALLWKLAEAGAGAVGLKGIEKYARKQERTIRKS